MNLEQKIDNGNGETKLSIYLYKKMTMKYSFRAGSKLFHLESKVKLFSYNIFQ